MDQNSFKAGGQNKSTSKILGALVIIVLALLVIVYLPKKGAQSTSEPITSTNPPIDNTPVMPPSDVPKNPPITKSSPYKDGSYNATGGYRSPNGQESIQVSLSLKNGIIQDAGVVGNAQGGRSKGYQNAFISGYKQLVIGKSIDEVLLDHVSGSSLTPSGWNDAITKIKIQART